MAYDGKVLARARDRYETEKERRRADFRRQRAEIYARVPRLVQIDAQLRGTVSRTIAAALRSGQDPAARVAALKEENLALQKERAAQLEQAGYPPDVLTEQPAGKLALYYNAWPQPVTHTTADDEELPLDPEVAVLLPLYMASQLYKDDDITLATMYRNEFEVAFSLLQRADTGEVGGEFTCATGWW